MASYIYPLLTIILFSISGYCSEKKTSSDNPETGNDSSQVNNDAGPSIAETIAQIANDPGAGFGGDR